MFARLLARAIGFIKVILFLICVKYLKSEKNSVYSLRHTETLCLNARDRGLIASICSTGAGEQQWSRAWNAGPGQELQDPKAL